MRGPFGGRDAHALSREARQQAPRVIGGPTPKLTHLAKGEGAHGHVSAKARRARRGRERPRDGGQTISCRGRRQKGDVLGAAIAGIMAAKDA